jgi:hypothetical protein
MKTAGNMRKVLTIHEEQVLEEMADNEVYGYGGKPFSSLPSCPQGLSRHSVLKMVELGFVSGLGRRVWKDHETGQEYVYGYNAVLKLRDLTCERKAELLDAFAKLFPGAKVLHYWHAGTSMRIVARKNDHLMMATAVGIEGDKPDPKTRKRFIDVCVQVECVERI